MQAKTKKRLFTLLAPLTLMISVVGFATFDKEQVTAETNSGVPILSSISDAIKPNETVTLTGYNLYADDLLVAYAPWDGNEPERFDENTIGCVFLEEDALSAVDTEGGSGLSLILPQDIDCGKYDFWVRANGVWSNGLTLNAVRPLYINQEATYEGLPIELVGRNFFASEYGVGTSAIDIENITVKLERVGDIDGTQDYVKETKIVPANSGECYTAEESVTGVSIAESNPYKITFTTPSVKNYGTYEIYVSTDGIHYRGLEEPQQLVIYEKKAQSWDETIFGEIEGNTCIGNDPLDLRSYWAQNLNYTNVQTVSPNTEATASNLASSIVAQSLALSKNGGGVLYFPAGEYYLSGVYTFYEKVIWVGAGADKTKIYYHTDDEGGGSWLKAQGISNIGFAHMTFTQTEATKARGVYPDTVLGLSDLAGMTDGGVSDVSLQTSKNKFITDVVFDFPLEVHTTQRRVCGINGAKNFVMQNVEYTGGAYGIRCKVYQYTNIRNTRFVCDGSDETLNVHSNYTFLENVSFEKQNHGHGISLRNTASVSNCSVKNLGNPNSNANTGETLVFEAPGGFFQTGDIVSATENTFTINLHSGSEINNNNTSLSYGGFAIHIISGTGAGQIRYFKRAPIGENTYQLLDSEKAWDVIPDASSHYTIISPMDNATIYRFNAENCAKGVYLYGQQFDAVVAECSLVDTEGVLIYSVANPQKGRINTSAQIRIVNNYIKGISQGTNKGGINVRLDTPYREESIGGTMYKGYGTYLQNITIRGNQVVDALPVKNFTGKTESEQSKRCGIVVDYSAWYDGDVNVSSDVKLITIENNRVERSQYGVQYVLASCGAVIRNNTYWATVTPEDINTGRMSTYLIEGNAYDKLDSLSLSLEEQMGLNVYMDFMTETVQAETATMTFAYGNGKTQSYDLTDGVLASDGCYKYTVWLDAEDVDTKVKVVLTVDGVDLINKSISMRGYIEDAKELYATDTATYDMLCVAEQYMDAAKAYFANEKVESVDGLVEEISAYAPTTEGELPAKISNVYIDLQQHGGTALLIYFKAESLSEIVGMVDGQRVVMNALGGGEYYIEISDIDPDKLGQTYEVKFNDYTLKVSALSYAYNILTESTNVNQINWMKAMYLYYQAAKIYFS